MRADIDLTTAEWIKSSYSSSNGGQCVEFSRSFAPAGVVPVRDSKDPHGAALVVPTDRWSSFVEAIKGGAFPV
ncbi:hypothetical protein SSP35_03_04860 [Streptomyces sp. NBRC 110611]|uniref:DUF397 domain-containing protein n=1 Tax=Streptomyces sp. NBRC 110611 TaxID=1621259 RepID=UPI00082A7A99|nr:DUF397 domain-containing protein [Streptomyces sp. NBRC 110611]GAU66838.1 hypothetical protein SSP35_03_04860 [Streptomyces sp. NBRC 110611]